MASRENFPAAAESSTASEPVATAAPAAAAAASGYPVTGSSKAAVSSPVGSPADDLQITSKTPESGISAEEFQPGMKDMLQRTLKIAEEFNRIVNIYSGRLQEVTWECEKLKMEAEEQRAMLDQVTRSRDEAIKALQKKTAALKMLKELTADCLKGTAK